MVESILDALFHPMFVRGVIAGSIVLVVGVILTSARKAEGVLRVGGLLVAAATVVVLYVSDMLGLVEVAGVTLLAIGGIFQRSVAIGPLLALPGALFVIRPGSADPQSWMPWFAVLVIIFAAPLVASFDDRYHETGLPLPLFGIATLGVFLTVPETGGAMVLLGVAGIAGFLGWPRPIASLGRAGSYAAVGVYTFVAADGAAARPASIIAAVAVLGLLLIVPIAIRLRRTGWGQQLDSIDAIFPLLAQLLLVLLISRTAGHMATVKAASALTIVFLAAAATLMLRRPSHLSE